MKISFSFPLFLSCVLALALAGGYAFSLHRIETSVTRIEEAIATAEALTKKDVALQATEVFLRETETLRAPVASVVVADDETVSIIQRLETLAREEGLDLSISTISEDDGGWQYHERVAVAFSLSGSFPAVMRFIGVLETLPQAARVEQGTLEKSGDRGWFGSFTATFVKEKL